MGILNVLNRAFIDYRKQTRNDTECTNIRNVLSADNVEFDSLESIRFLVHIEEDWIIRIEKGLEFIEKAIQEDRQFIITQGEVVPIEKAKKVSKGSIEHLSKHSELINELPKEEDDVLIPKSIYMVERLTDYAVYENKFLYMVLCYLRDFTNNVYEKIIEIKNTFEGKLHIKKDIHYNNRFITCEIDFYEKKMNNPYSIDNQLGEKLLGRIKNLSTSVNAYLNMPLMQEVSKAPKIKPPIVKTNVLKMDNNFKEVLALYEYISNYDKAGFVSEEIKKNYAPFSPEISDEVSEIVSLTSFITYVYGNEIKGLLKKEYLKEEQIKKQIEDDKNLAELKSLKRKFDDNDEMTMLEYIIKLEKTNKSLEIDHIQLIKSLQTIEELNGKIKEFEDEIGSLKEVINKKDQEIEFLNSEIIRIEKEYQEKIAKLIEEYECKLAEQKQYYEEVLNKTIEEYDGKLVEQKTYYEELIASNNEMFKEELNEQKTYYENLLADTATRYESEITELLEKHKNTIDDLNSKHTDELNSIITTNNENIEKLNDEIEAIKDKYDKEIIDITKQYEDSIASIRNNYEDQLKVLNEKIVSMEDMFKSKIAEFKKKTTILEKDYKEEIEAITQESNNKSIEIKSINSKHQNDIKKLQEKYDFDISVLEHEKYLALGELDALREMYGVKFDEDLTEQERFEQLEKEYEAFKILFKRVWTDTKAKIKNEILKKNGKK